MKVKEESEKAGLKLNIQKTKIMTSAPIISWQIEGEKVEAVTHFVFLGSKITADGDSRHGIKRCLLLAMTNLDSVLKRKDISLPALGSFPVSEFFTSCEDVKLQIIGVSASVSVLPVNIQD